MSWRDHAYCKALRIDTETFFLPDTEGMNRADASALAGGYQRTVKWLRKDVCAHCPVLSECRLASLPELGGAWAGVTERKRDPIRWLYTGGPDGITVEELSRRVLEALEQLDAGVPWDEALDAAGIDDHPFFHDFDGYGGRKSATPTTTEGAAA